MADEVIVWLAVFAVYMGVLGIGGIVADYIFPCIPPLRRWIDSLPEKDDDSEIYRQEMERIRRNRAARRRWMRKMIRRIHQR